MAMWTTVKARVKRAYGMYAAGQVVTVEGEGDIERLVDGGFVELIGEVQLPETATAEPSCERAVKPRTKRKYTMRNRKPAKEKV
jgi:hypothetical protein